jgi:hypothetical protein
LIDEEDYLMRNADCGMRNEIGEDVKAKKVNGFIHCVLQDAECGIIIPKSEIIIFGALEP